IGDATAVDLSDAREQASDMLKVCRRGDDPRIAIRAKAEEAIRQHRDTFEAVAEAFIKEYVSKRRTADHIASAIRRHLVPKWRNPHSAAITTDDVAKRIRTLATDGSPHTARRMLAHAKVLFRWASEPGRSYFKINPTIGLTAKTFDIKTD